MPEIVIIPVGFDIKPETKPEPDYARELGLACWCNDAEQCQNEEH
jgi:hypothetical protein